MAQPGIEVRLSAQELELIKEIDPTALAAREVTSRDDGRVVRIARALSRRSFRVVS